MEMKHTPGPWQVGMAFDNYGETEIAIEHMTPAGNLVVAVALGGLQGQDANASLIAAAPDLFDFASLVSRMTTDSEMGGNMSGDDAAQALSELIETARAAIAKATGSV